MTWDCHWLIIIFCLTSLKLQLIVACAAQLIVMCFNSAHRSVDSQSNAQSWTWCFLFMWFQLNLVARSDDICHMRSLKNSIRNTNLQNDTRRNRLTRHTILNAKINWWNSVSYLYMYVADLNRVCSGIRRHWIKSYISLHQWYFWNLDLFYYLLCGL